MTSFTDLIDDVILLLPQHLTERDLNSLSRASKGLHALLDPVLYTRHVRSHGSWALAWAARRDRVSLVRRLQALGADLIHRTDDKNLPLRILAARLGAVEVTKLLLSTPGFDPNLRDQGTQPALLSAAGADRAEIVELYLADPRVDPHVANHAGDTALGIAAYEGHAGVLEVTLRDGRMDPCAADEWGNTPLIHALWGNLPNAACVRLLLADPRVDVNATYPDGMTALHAALLYSDPSNVQPLLDAGADPNARDDEGKTPLMRGAEERSDGAVEVLHRAPGLDVNVQDNRGHTALMHAVLHQGGSGPVPLLVADKRVLPNLAAHDGETPLMRACSAALQCEVTVLLRRPDLDLSLRDGKGRTALHIAIRALTVTSNARSYKIIEMLCERARPATMIAAGGQHPVDAGDRRRRNAMSYAAAHGPQRVVELLLEIEREVEGVDWMQPDSRGRDAAWYARQKGRHHIADLLEEGRDLSARGRDSSSSSESSPTLGCNSSEDSDSDVSVEEA